MKKDSVKKKFVMRLLVIVIIIALLVTYGIAIIGPMIE